MVAEFCDTNVVAYAYDVSERAKHEVANALLARLWAGGGGLISTQVLQELYITLTNRAKVAMEDREARAIVANLTVWSVYSPSAEDVIAAIDRAREWQVSLWDSLIITAAAASGASLIWSEDLSHDRIYGDVIVRNPFAG